MKAVLTLAVLAVLATANDASVIKASKANLNIGYPAAGHWLLYKTYVFQPAVANAVQFQDVVYRGYPNTRISAVQATEVGASQWARSYIVAGGIGYNYVLSGLRQLGASGTTTYLTFGDVETSPNLNRFVFTPKIL